MTTRTEHGMHSFKLMKEDLKTFWARTGLKLQETTPWLSGVRLDELRRLAEYVYPFKHREPIKDRRFKFEIARRQKRYFKHPCFVCGGKTGHRHHIIQLQHGGGNSKRNVVALCLGCHGDVHGKDFGGVAWRIV